MWDESRKLQGEHTVFCTCFLSVCKWKTPRCYSSFCSCPLCTLPLCLQVYVDIPGGLNLSLSLPLVIGTIPLHACATRTSSISSNCSTLTWLGLSHTERPEGTWCKHSHMLISVLVCVVQYTVVHKVLLRPVCLLLLQHRQATAIWQYQRLTGGIVCRAVIVVTGRERTRDLC